MSVAVCELKCDCSYRENFCCSLVFSYLFSVRQYLFGEKILQNTEVNIHEFGLEVNTEKVKPMLISSAECKESSEYEDK